MGKKEKHKSKEYKCPEKAKVKILSLHAGLINEAFYKYSPAAKTRRESCFLKCLIFNKEKTKYTKKLGNTPIQRKKKNL